MTDVMDFLGQISRDQQMRVFGKPNAIYFVAGADTSSDDNGVELTVIGDLAALQRMRDEHGSELKKFSGVLISADPDSGHGGVAQPNISDTGTAKTDHIKIDGQLYAVIGADRVQEGWSLTLEAMTLTQQHRDNLYMGK